MAANKKIRVLLVDDHYVVRVGLAASLELDPALKVVGEASSAEQALQESNTSQPDVVLADMRLPGMDGAGLSQRLRELKPEVAVLILSTYQRDDEIVRALQCGAKGYIPKTIGREALLEAVKSVHAGKTYLPPESPPVWLRKWGVRN
jgi:DNA-binding NarL/FixJ family response regulator